MSIKKQLEEIQGLIDDYRLESAIASLKELANDFNQSECVEEFVDDEDVAYITQNCINNDYSNWQNLVYLFAKVKYPNEDYYYLDGYENLRNVNQNDVQCALDDLKRNLQDDIEDEEIHCCHCEKVIGDVDDEDELDTCEECGDFVCSTCATHLDGTLYCPQCAKEMEEES